MTLSIIAAMSTNGVIGRDGKIPWKMPRDHNRFISMVDGHPVIMGARTWHSHEFKLSNSIVVSNTMEEQDRATVVRSVDAALRMVPIIAAKYPDETFVLGGHDIFRALIPYADRMYLTLVHAFVEGDARFPVYDAQQWMVVKRTNWDADRANEHPYSFLEMVRGF